MRSRPIRIELYLNEKEFEKLKQVEDKSGLTRQQLLRNLILNVKIKEQPTAEIATVRRALSAIGNNVNQIARVVNTQQNVSNEQLTVIRKMLTNLWEWIEQQ